MRSDMSYKAGITQTGCQIGHVNLLGSVGSNPNVVVPITQGGAALHSVKQGDIIQNVDFHVYRQKYWFFQERRKKSYIQG